MKERSVFFDDLKGVLILLVIVGHVISICPGCDGANNILYLLIYSFHMPLFVFISGYFSTSCYKRGFREMLNGRLKRLILPLLIYSTIICVLFFVSGASEQENKSVLHKVYNIYVSYWYLINIVILTSIYWVGKKNWLLCLFLTIIYFVCLFVYDLLPGYVLKDCQIIRLAPIFGLGILCKNCISKLPSKAILLLGLLMASIIVFVDRFYFGINIFDYPVYIRIIDGIACSYVFVFLYVIIYRFIKTKNNGFIISKIGKDSLAYYLIHLVFIRFISYFNIAPQYNFFNMVVLTVLITVLTALAISVIKKTISSKYHYLLGL